MSGYIRQIQASDGSPITPPTTVTLSSASIVVFANDAAYEAVYTAIQGSKYFNSTELLEREHDGTGWVYVNKALTATTDAATTGTDNDLSATRFDLIRFTEGSLASIRSIDPAQHKIIYMVNDQASQSITWVNEDGTATAANTIITGTGDDLIQEVDQVLAFIYDSESSRWRIAGGTGAGGGGLEISVITNAESPVTAEIGKWYLTDTSAGPITVNMPDLSVIPTSKQGGASMRFSDCKANWQVQPVTLVPFSGQSIDGAVADETMVLDVESQYVWCARETASNWCFDTNIQPTLESGGGTGEGRVNLFPNSDFEDGTTDWSSTKPAQITLETSTPLQGAQSLKITSDGAGQVVSTTLTVSDDAYKTIQHGIEGVIDIPLTATTGDWVARFKRNGTTIANSESDLAPGRNRLQDLMAGFAPLLDTITFEIEDVSASASDVATCDIFVLTPQGQGNVTEWPSYDENEGPTYSATPSGWSLIRSIYQPYYTADGRVLMYFYIVADTDSLSTPSITINGITFKNTAGNFVPLSVDSGNQSYTARAIVVPNSGTINIQKSTAATGWRTQGTVELDSWPTWATKGGNIQLLDNNGLYENAKARFYRNAAYSYTANTTFAFDQESTLIKRKGINNSSGIITVDSSGDYHFNIVTFASATHSARLKLYKNGVFVCYIGKATNTVNMEGSATVYVSTSDSITFQGTQGFTVSTGDTDTWIEVTRVPDSTGNQATGAGTSSLANENPQNVLVNYQAMTPKAADNQFTGGNISATRIGDTITVTSDVALTDPGDTSPATSVGFLPVDFRPSTEVSNLFFMTTTRVYMVRVKSDGQIECEYRDWAGGATAPSTSGRPITITYRV
jgi:hypothetical protein